MFKIPHSWIWTMKDYGLFLSIAFMQEIYIWYISEIYFIENWMAKGWNCSLNSERAWQREGGVPRCRFVGLRTRCLSRYARLIRPGMWQRDFSSAFLMVNYNFKNPGQEKRVNIRCTFSKLWAYFRPNLKVNQSKDISKVLSLLKGKSELKTNRVCAEPFHQDCRCEINAKRLWDRIIFNYSGRNRPFPLPCSH